MIAILIIEDDSGVLRLNDKYLLRRMVDAINNEETAIITTLFLLNNIWRECSQVRRNIINKTSASVIAVPNATPKAGFSFQNTIPNNNENPMFVIAPNNKVKR